MSKLLRVIPFVLIGPAVLAGLVPRFSHWNPTAGTVAVVSGDVLVVLDLIKTGISLLMVLIVMFLAKVGGPRFDGSRYKWPSTHEDEEPTVWGQFVLPLTIVPALAMAHAIPGAIAWAAVFVVGTACDFGYRWAHREHDRLTH